MLHKKTTQSKIHLIITVLPILVAARSEWDCGFESSHRHEYLSLVSVVRCQVEDTASSRSVVQRSPTECGMSVIVKPLK